MEDLLDDEAIREKVHQLESEAKNNLAKQMNNVLKDALGAGFKNIFGEGIIISAPQSPTILSPDQTKPNSLASSVVKMAKVDEPVGEALSPGPATLAPKI